ncbi:MAG: rhamnulokinase, partial [Treponema sp.]|nr:rhamnulokinase [Treponema sp.]
GASSGRHILGWLEKDVLRTKEVYRFENHPKPLGGELCWDIDALYAQVLAGIKECKKIDMVPASLGIDSWGVDFVLLDRENKRLGNAVCYRDRRTEGMEEDVEKLIPFDELYRRTGIQKQPFNTIYQLAALKKQKPALLEKAAAFLMIPDYLHYLLGGTAINEYTNATTTALMGAQNRAWDTDLINKLGFPASLFKPLAKAGDTIGMLSGAAQEEAGFSCAITLPATHDTASAFLAAPAKDTDSVYLSSGTWSLLGMENQSPIVTDAGRKANFSNEGGFEYHYCFLRNIMGLWMIQSVRNEFDKKYSFAELEAAAREAASFNTIVDVDDREFLAPENMREALAKVCEKTGQKVPSNVPETMQCLYRSLAAGYEKAIRDMVGITGKRFSRINLVGGGSKDRYLNHLTAELTGLPVFAGPTEASVAGNLIVQMIAAHEVTDIGEARNIITRSFSIEEFGSET